VNFLSDGLSQYRTEQATRWARLKPQSQRAYPPVYHRRWFPVLDQHPDATIDTLDGYIWVETPWKIQSLWAAHLEIADKPV
jgi:hypothetical protein